MPECAGEGPTRRNHETVRRHTAKTSDAESVYQKFSRRSTNDREPYERYGPRADLESHARTSMRSPMRVGDAVWGQGFPRALGRAIRAGRGASGLTLRDLERRTDGRFKPSAVGAYERAERDISVQRFVDLAHAIGVAPESLLADALHRLHPKTHREALIDVRRLADEPGKTSGAVAEYVQRVRLARRDYFGDEITLRSGDLEIIASELGQDPGRLITQIRGAIVRMGPKD